MVTISSNNQKSRDNDFEQKKLPKNFLSSTQSSISLIQPASKKVKFQKKVEHSRTRDKNSKMPESNDQDQRQFLRKG